MLDFCISEIIRLFTFHGQMVNAKIHRKKYPQIAHSHFTSENHVHTHVYTPWKELAAFIATMYSEGDNVYSADPLTGDQSICT